jgi:hypothetical protein
MPAARRRGTASAPSFQRSSPTLTNDFLYSRRTRVPNVMNCGDSRPQSEADQEINELCNIDHPVFITSIVIGVVIGGRFSAEVRERSLKKEAVRRCWKSIEQHDKASLRAGTIVGSAAVKVSPELTRSAQKVSHIQAIGYDDGTETTSRDTSP